MGGIGIRVVRNLPLDSPTRWKDEEGRCQGCVQRVSRFSTSKYQRVDSKFCSSQGSIFYRISGREVPRQ